MTTRDTQFEALTIDRFHAALVTRELTASELVEWYLARIEAHNDARAENPRRGDGQPPSTRRSCGTLGLCGEAGLVKVGEIAVDGTRMRANASRDRNRGYESIVSEILQ
ncbi:MAG: hypothetical protein JO304_12590, partial [Solirubrobacterales bacterium]|nr:hypothetical protein [Solirubrobacterales bacterium]